MFSFSICFTVRLPKKLIDSYSTDNVSLKNIFESIATKSHIDVIFTDFNKSSDKVDPRLLLQKIHIMGIRGKLFQVFKSFLVARRQQVHVGDSFSKEFLATSGEQQGSIISTFLFLIFTNDFPDLRNEVYHLLFAEDAKLICVGF